MRGEITPAFAEILTPTRSPLSQNSSALLGDGARNVCSGGRSDRQRSIAVRCSIFCRRRKQIREGDWTCAPIPADLRDRRVEITGPTDRKMVINALNSGAKIFMADFEDANAPTLGKHDRGPDQPARRDPAHDHFHQS